VINLLDPDQYGRDEICGARHHAGLTQVQAAKLIGYSRRGWQDAESGRTKLHPAAWALFLLATGQHPLFSIE